MSNRPLDVLFVHAGGTRSLYQGLRDKYSCIEPPTWSLLLAQSCRAKGYGVRILDCDALGLSNQYAVSVIHEAKPRLVVFCVYGSEPNAGTARMAGATELASLLRDVYPQYKIAFVGTHTSALPKEVLAYPFVDFVLLGEGVYALNNLLLTDLQDVAGVKGLGWKDGHGEIHLSDAAGVVPQNRMDTDLPGYAWDLLPKREKPFDLYRSHNWHADFNESLRTPSAALYTSLGCTQKCSFCCINLINRTSAKDGITSADSATLRYWSAQHTLNQIHELVIRDVTTIRLSDEMFFLNKQHYKPLLEGIRKYYGDRLRLWAYARVDTIRPVQLKLFREAGVRWLCLGIESANQIVRREVDKGGSYEEVDIRRVVKEVQDAGINVIANYIFGLPDDTYETMQETLALSLDLNTEMWNAYPCIPIPGTPLYYEALEKQWQLPDSFAGYGFLSYECQPLPTKTLSAREVLDFRDKAFRTYFNREEYLSLVERKFSLEQRRHVEELVKIKLKRKLLGD